MGLPGNMYRWAERESERKIRRGERKREETDGERGCGKCESGEKVREGKRETDRQENTKVSTERQKK